MARPLLIPRKQRTRQHVIADLGIHYVEGFVLEEGHTAQQLGRDYGYDLLMFTYDERGYVEPGFISLQVKSAESLQSAGAGYVFDLDVRDYNLWMAEKMPVILVLFDAGRRRAYWLAVKDYFRQDVARRPPRGAKTIRVRVDGRQSLNRRAIARMRAMKNDLYRTVSGGSP
jgi:Domain of unknown function (DUF4365)